MPRIRKSLNHASAWSRADIYSESDPLLQQTALMAHTVIVAMFLSICQQFVNCWLLTVEYHSV